MYLIYVDEAGTSAREPVTVVVGIIVHADSQWFKAQDALRSTIDKYVPDSLKAGFIFHAKEIWNHKKWREVLSVEQRFSFISEVSQIPRNQNLAICLGKTRRDFTMQTPGLAPEKFHHLMAFQACLARGNKFIRDWGNGELATVVAEDVTDLRKLLKKVLYVPEPRFPLTSDFVRLTADDRRNGTIQQSLPGPIDRLVDTPNFVEKSEAPLLQIADACAFIFRRYFAGQENGETWLESMLNLKLHWDDWQGPTSQMVFSMDPTKSYRDGSPVRS